MFSTGQTVVISVGLVMAAALGFTTASALRHDASTPSSAPPSPSAPAPASTTTRATTAPEQTARATGSDALCSAEVVIQDEWQDGFKAEIRITNTSSATVKDWVAGFVMPDGAKLSGGWQATLDQDGSAMTAEAPEWAHDLAAGKKAVFGFTATGVPSPPPGQVTLNGAHCS